MTNESSDCHIFGGKRILIVDDSPDNRFMLELYLRKTGAEVLITEDGHSAVQLARSEPLDLIIMDIQMPRMDGNSAMKELRSIGYTKPVVALSAHAMAEDRDQSMALGFAAYFTKPISRGLLIQRLRVILGV